MYVQCATCERVYNDETNWTTCPHNPLGVSAAYCRRHDLDPCPYCDPVARNPLVKS